MTRPTTAAPRTPAALVVALALAASASVGALPAAAAAPLERVVVTGLDAAGGVADAGGRVLQELPLVDGVAALLPRGAQLPASLRVTPDRPLSVQSSGPGGSGPASTVRGTLGLPATGAEGSGVTVAVVDTGVESAALGEVRRVTVRGTEGEDGLGHGTFIAGLVKGTDALPGVAPAAEVLDVKVADADGSTSLLDVLRGLQAVHADGSVDVVNLSLSSDSPLPAAVDPLAVALERLWDDGVVVVVPSGNDPATVSSPGTTRALLTVGGLAEAGSAERADDTVAAWSGRRGGKPELVAPGQSLVSVVAPGSEAEAAQEGRGLPAGYGLGSGTSFATAVTSGAAAALLAARPGLTPDQVKTLLTGTAYRTKALGRDDGAGAGGLDLRAALAAPTPKAGRTAPQAQLPAGDLATWERFVEAMLSGDAETAASSWSLLSPQARHWVARHWVGLDEETRAWEARHWIARHWVVEGWSEQEWLARHWVARHWAARHWVDSGWSARHWTDGEWAARHWVARHWSEDSWSARHWSARHWSARHWSARQWSTTTWG